jgi:hypothetical protein
MRIRRGDDWREGRKLVQGGLAFPIGMEQVAPDANSSVRIQIGAGARSFKNAARRDGETTGDRSVRRSHFIVVTAYIAAAIAWVGFAAFVAPGVVGRSYHGVGPAPLVRLLAGAHHPLEHYLALWRSFWVACLLALCVHLLLVLRLTNRRGPEPAPPAWVPFYLGTFSALFLVVTVVTGPRQDYVAYIDIWKVVRAGGDPWWVNPALGYPINAYGPLFTTLALPAAVSGLAPKVFFAGTYLGAMIWLTEELAAGRGIRRRTLWLLLAMLSNPSAWIQVAWYGHFDVLVGAACIAAVEHRVRGRDKASGACLAIGTLLKFVPIVMLPFLALDGKRGRLRLAAVTLGLVAAGMAAAYLVWGAAALRSIGFAARRGSNLLSIFRYLRGSYSPLSWTGRAVDLDRFSLPVMLVAGIAVLVAWRGRRGDAITGSVLAIVTTLLFYKVGFVQYQMLLYLMVPYWVMRGRAVSNRAIWAAGLYIAWIACFDVFDFSVGGIVGWGRRWAWVEDLVGLPTFILGAHFASAILRKPAQLVAASE